MSEITRRNVTRGAAWAAPVVAVVGAASVSAASPKCDCFAAPSTGTLGLVPGGTGSAGFFLPGNSCSTANFEIVGGTWDITWSDNTHLTGTGGGSWWGNVSGASISVWVATPKTDQTPVAFCWNFTANPAGILCSYRVCWSVSGTAMSGGHFS